MVIVLTCKLFYLISYEYFIVADRFLKADSFQAGTSGKCYVSLSTCKYASSEVYLYLFESEALTFVNGDGPRQSEWILGISSDFLFFYFFLCFIEMVAHIAPGSRFHHHIFPVFCSYIDSTVFVVVKSDDGS